MPVATLGSLWHAAVVAQLGLKIGARTSFANETFPEVATDETAVVVLDDVFVLEPDEALPWLVSATTLLELDTPPWLALDLFDVEPDMELWELMSDASESSVGRAASPEEQPAAIAATKRARALVSGKTRRVRHIMR